MTVRQYLRVLARRWYVLLGMMLCTAALVAVLPRDTSVYWARLDVVFLPPPNPKVPSNVLETSDQSVIYFAAAIERQVNGPWEPVALSSRDATLYGAGVRRGYSVDLFNSGGQWASNFNRPMLSVQAVTPSEQETRTLILAVVDRIESLARAQQAASGAPPASFISTELSAPAPAVARVGGSWTRAAAALTLLGTLISLATTALVDRSLEARRRRNVAVVVAGPVQASAANVGGS